jgi:iron complex transport system substrate-binding protein
MLLALTLALLAGCAPQAAPTPAAEPTPAAITLTDGLGRAVTLNATPERIVSLAPSNTELLFAVGAGGQVVGRDEFSNYPADAGAIQSVGGSMGKYDLEAIAALKPDLVLASELNNPELVQSIAALNIPVYYLGNPKDFDGLYANIQTVGQLAGKPAEAAALVDSLKARVKAVEEKIAPLSSTFSVFYEIDATEPAKPWTAGPGTFVSTLIRMAGGTNIADDLDADFGQISQEALIQRDPMVILLGDSKYGATPEQVKARPGWDALSAVQDGRVYAFDDDLVSRPGPRLVDGLEQMAGLLRPGLFE